MQSPCPSEPGDPKLGYWRYHLIDKTVKCWYPSAQPPALTPKQHALPVAIKTEEPVRKANASKIIIRHVSKHYWTGPYVGGNVGFGFASIGLGPYARPAPVAGIEMPYVNSNGANPMMGGQGGYRIRNGQWMFALEEQFDWMNIQTVNWDTLNSSRIAWTNDTDGIVGYVINPYWLLFVGAGLSEGKRFDNCLLNNFTTSSELLGYNLEIGTQVAITEHVATGIKYQYTNFGPGTAISAIKWNLDFTWIKIEDDLPMQ